MLVTDQGPPVPLRDLVSLRGRTALVTGGGQGIGRAAAERLAEAGASIAIADLDAGRASAAAAQIAQRHGVAAVGVAMDVAELAAVEQAASAAADAVGTPDIWVNNAGIFPSSRLDDMTDDEWDRVFAVNVRGVRNGAKVAAGHMADAGGGVIVNIASLAAFEGTAPGLAAYVGSKHAVRGITRQLAIELAPRGIRVLAVAPTFVPTEGTLAAGAAAMRAADAPDVPAMPAPRSLIGRMASADDVARVVLFCASGLSAAMTGSTLLADAGATA